MEDEAAKYCESLLAYTIEMVEMTNTLEPAIVKNVAGNDDGSGEDYVGNEEEYETYKMCDSPNNSQSEQFKQEKQQELETNALISSTTTTLVGLLLVRTWNWLRYFFVTIIFLNLARFANSSSNTNGLPQTNQSQSVVVDVDQEGGSEPVTTVPQGKSVDEEKVEDFAHSTSSFIKEEKSAESGNIIGVNEDNSTEDDEVDTKQLKMSPNTCSIQNPQQEVEKAEEAVVAAVVVPEKSESIIAPSSETNEATLSDESSADESVEKKEEEEAVASLVETMQEKLQIISVLTEVDDEEESDESGDVDGTRRESVDSVSSAGSGNLGDAEEDGSCGKSQAEDDSSSVSSGNNNREVDAKEVAQKIISQVESMFSDEHLAKDGFLLKHVRRRSDGFVSLKLVAGLRKVKQISREFPTVLDALKDSSRLEINGEGTKVRRVEPLTPFLKSVPIKSKDKDQKGKDKDGSSNEENSAPINTGSRKNSDNAPKQNRRHSHSVQSNVQNNINQNRRNSSVHNHHPHNNRKSSTASTTTGSSTNSSRHNSFSKPPGHGCPSSLHPADLFRNVYTSSMMAAYSSSGEECQSPQVNRKRGGSLPITALQRSSMGNLSPNSSPPNGAFVMIGPNGGARPKSNSYCEGAGPSTMSPWLQRRKASATSRFSNGELTFTGVMRQPRGPDGTKGFASGYRAMIIQERLQQQINSVSA